ncbi:MAG: flagellar basal body P-ring protein FlgI [Methylococcales bacterium]|nr:flagellar basal body P-ring protein FlgI [Methylococcales bacterium]
MSIKTMLLTLLLMLSASAQGERIKDLATLAGVRDNQLVGYGLVVGLASSGDKTLFTGQTLTNMMTRLGIRMPPGLDPRAKNIAAVMVSAHLPAFAKPGQTIDVTVASVGDAKSLRGGSLLMTPLKGADGQVYAMAQGSLVVNGLSEAGLDGSRITVNTPTTGRIPSGATVERTVANPFSQGNHLVFNLNSPDFTTAHRMAEAINNLLGPDTARARDAVSIKVNAPNNLNQKVSFAALLENIEIKPDDAPAKVIVNSRTGTVVINSKVTVQPAAVTHGSLTVTISENPTVSQPEPFGQGETAVVPDSEVTVEEANNRMFVFNPGVSLDAIVNAVNQVGASPSDLVAILEALKSAGALRAELIVI